MIHPHHQLCRAVFHQQQLRLEFWFWWLSLLWTFREVGIVSWNRERDSTFICLFLFLWGRRKQKSDSVKLSNIASLTPDCQLIGDETFAPKALRWLYRVSEQTYPPVFSLPAEVCHGDRKIIGKRKSSAGAHYVFDWPWRLLNNH